MVILPVVADENNPHGRWPGVSLGIIKYSLTNLERMEDWVCLAAREYKKIWWCDLHGKSNAGCSYGSTQWFTFYATFDTTLLKELLNIAAPLYLRVKRYGIIWCQYNFIGIKIANLSYFVYRENWSKLDDSFISRTDSPEAYIFSKFDKKFLVSQLPLVKGT